MYPQCRICYNTDKKDTYIVSEKHFGTLDKFEYFECPNCKTLQITTIPEDIGKYYPDNYYSKISIEQSKLKLFLKEKWYQHYFGNKNIIGHLLSHLKGIPDFFEWLGKLNLKKDSSILDVGSGYGLLLSELELAGFTNLTGIDPYINESVRQSNNLQIIKGTLNDIFEKELFFHTIIFNHSLEHVPNPRLELQESRKLQTKGDKLIVRIPLGNSYAWEKYRINWASLDAPRHFHLLTPKAMEILALESNYQIIDTIYDSTDFQFWASELYKNDIPLTATKLGSKDPMSDFRQLISEEQSKEFREMTKKLNQEKKGDQATFFLKAI